MKLVLIVAISLFVIALGDHEWIRYQAALETCRKDRISDVSLAATDFCRNTDRRTGVCDAAEGRLVYTIKQCARNRWRTESHYAQMWNMLTEDYLRVWALVVPLLGVIAWRLIGGYWDTQKEHLYVKQRAELAHQYLNPFQLQGRKKKKRRRNDEPERLYDASWYDA